MATIDEIVEQVRNYNPHADVELIRRAYACAEKAHEGQMRLTGDPYITHPLEAARTLADLEMDATSIAAGLLHDVVEDSRVTIDEIRTQFGAEISLLVDGVTKLKLADFEINPREPEKGVEAPKKRHAELKRSAENLRKIFLAMARDLRVMIIKLADRLHNLSTLYALPADRQRRVASETLQIYAPLAHRLGIWKIKWQLEDLAFKYLEPEAYETVAEKVARTRSDREEDLKEAVELIKARLAKDGIDAYIQARPKHLYSIYQKMLKEGVDFQEIYDLSALRIIVNTVADCYQALGMVHDQWMPIPDRFTDHIAKSKSNMYQSLHTKVVGPRGEPIEIQIRTWEMHRMAEFGIAAHWQYKEGEARPGDEFERKLSWLRQQLFDWQADTEEPNEFLRSVINDLFTDQVFVFTPKGDVIDLPAGSTPVDFAYRIHSDLGNHIVGGKVNGRIVPLSYKFSNGDIVEVITRSNSQPSLDWLSFVKTSHARNRIKGHFRKLHHTESVAKGREMLEREMERLGHEAMSVLKPDKLLKVAQTLNLQSDEDMLAAIGYGHVAAATVVNRLKAELPAQDVLVVGSGVRPQGEAKLALSIDGADQMMIKRGRCCAPIPGEEVVGYITRGRGMALHRQVCPNVAAYRSQEPDRLVPVDWNQSDAERYPTEIRIEALDRVGLLNDISAIFSEAKTNINAAKIRSMPNRTARLDLTVDVQDVNHLNALMTSIARLSDIMRIERVASNGPSRQGDK
ncbi:MAG: bifunctional (p)ppGpp synthetase/guanosine-3',5'-bis(diphosphate) 3'-pyrophosphohydrolase [Armatimonadota bacterium]|nr:bifunctional (p)ppGpp synthetase/guanosine-3',5'-bis(diphosphate) 3'-pyrophosphohydrolase [Armatimonadota bacterium]